MKNIFFCVPYSRLRTCRIRLSASEWRRLWDGPSYFRDFWGRTHSNWFLCNLLRTSNLSESRSEKLLGSSDGCRIYVCWIKTVARCTTDYYIFNKIYKINTLYRFLLFHCNVLLYYSKLYLFNLYLIQL